MDSPLGVDVCGDELERTCTVVTPAGSDHLRWGFTKLQQFVRYILYATLQVVCGNPYCCMGTLIMGCIFACFYINCCIVLRTDWRQSPKVHVCQDAAKFVVLGLTFAGMYTASNMTRGRYALIGSDRVGRLVNSCSLRWSHRYRCLCSRICIALVSVIAGCAMWSCLYATSTATHSLGCSAGHACAHA